MRLELSNGDVAYFEQNNIRLQEINGSTYIVGNTTLYGITENGQRVRLYASKSDTSDMHTLDFYEYSSRWGWVDSNVEIVWNSVPPSMRADDTYNFDNFSLSQIGIVIILILSLFTVFKRR